jgi:hypothetical protein
VAVTYSQALLDRATAYLDQPLTARRYAEGLAEISHLVSDITGEASGSCRQCQYLDYVAIVKNYQRAATRFLHPELMVDSKYTIAPGLENETFVHEGYGSTVTAENLTDEAAEFFIRKGFSHAFLLKPGAEAAKPESDKPLTEKQTLQARYKELFGEQPEEKVTIAELKEAIKTKEDSE